MPMTILDNTLCELLGGLSGEKAGGVVRKLGVLTSINSLIPSRLAEGGLHTHNSHTLSGGKGNELPLPKYLTHALSLSGFATSPLYALLFLPARRYASAGLCDSDVSVRLSGRLSVTRRYCA